MSLTSYLARGAFSVFIVHTAGALLLLLSEVVLARLLGVEQFGLYAVVTAWMFVLFLLASLGFNAGLLRYVPVYAARESWGELRGLLVRSSRWTAAAAVVLAATAFLLIRLLSEPGALAAAAFSVALIGLPLQTLSSLRQGVLRGLQQNVRALFPENVLRPLLLLVLLGLGVWFYPAPFTAVEALACNLVAIGTAFALGSRWQRRYLPAAVRRAEPVFHDREWFSVALPLLGTVGMGLVESSRMDVILLGLLRGGGDEAGIYAAANRLAEIIFFVFAIATIVIVPMIARLHATGDHDELQRLVATADKFMLCLALPLAIFLVLFGKGLLSLFGPDFAAGYFPLLLLIAVQMVTITFGPVLFLLTMTGHQREALKIMVFAVGIKLIMALLLIPAFGMPGAAGATLAGILVSNIIMRRLVRARLGIEPSAVALLDRPPNNRRRREGDE